VAVSEVRRLTEARRVQQSRRAAAVAALVAFYYRRIVKLDDPRSIDRWLEKVMPLVMQESDKQAIAAAKYGNALRVLELGGGRQSFTFEPVKALTTEQLEKSLRHVGPDRERRALEKILPDRAPFGEEESSTVKISRANTRKALEEEIRETALRSVGGAVARHAQNGARQTTYDNIQADPVCLGYLRVTKSDPCYFCAALASRGIIYGEDSFDESDPRFTGNGTAKVHDSCACALKPVYTDSDEYTVDAANFEALWFEGSVPTGNSSDPMYNFRRYYEKRMDGPSLRDARRRPAALR